MNITVQDGVVWVDGVEHRRPQQNVTELLDLQDRIAALRDAIESMLGHAQSLYDNYSMEKLSIGMIEAEGYLRAAKEINDEFNEIMAGIV